MFKRLINYYKRKKKLLSLFNHSHRYLCSGNYATDTTLNVFYNQGSSLNQKSQKLFKKIYAESYFINLEKRQFNVIKKIVNWKIKKKYKHFFKVSPLENPMKEFKGEVFLPFSNFKGYKVFDFRSEKVLYFFLDKDEFQKKIDSYEYFKKYFKIPRIVSNAPKQMTIIEEYIEHKSVASWNEGDYHLAFKKVFASYNAYYVSLQKYKKYKFQTLASMIQELPKSNYCQFLLENIEESLLTLEWPVVCQHGDLAQTNIILSNGEVFFIDWDRVNQLIFIFDILKFIWSDERYLNKYVQGFYNDEMEKLFDCWNLTFNPDFLMDYIYIFLLIYYQERLLALPEALLTAEQHKNQFKLDQLLKTL